MQKHIIEKEHKWGYYGGWDE